jgi:hypothetical protein
MIPGVSAVTQALLGTLFTWGVTALGASLVFLGTGKVKMAPGGNIENAMLTLAAHLP